MVCGQRANMSFSSSKVSKDINNMWCLVIPIFATALFYITDHPPPSMAQITARGTLKALFDRDGGRGAVRMRTEQKGDKYLLRNKLRARSHASRLLSSSSSSAATSVQGSSSQRTESNEAAAADDDDGVYEVCYEEFDKDGLDCFRGLVLDVSYRPINVVCWRRAICLEFLDKADVLEYYDQTVNSPSGSFYIPAVLRIPHLLTVVKRRRVKNTLGRKNILYRDNHTCQYCSSRENLTVDHVLPIARGGAWKWENLVTACSRCNSRKGQKTVEEANMKLMKAPKPPKDFDIVAIPLTTKAIQTLRMRKGTPEEWHQYLSMPSAEP